jgi:hypothetical protein
LKFKFDMNSNWFVIYKTDLKKQKNFLIGNRLQAEFGAAQPASPRARPAQPSRPAPQPNGFTGMHRITDPNQTR